MQHESSSPSHDSAFPPTQWTIIVDAVSTNPVRAREALERLCGLYRQPIVNWFKRKDFHQDPEDLAQGFLLYLLEKSLLGKVALRTGRFRCFLAATMRNFLLDSWDKAGAQKRGGGVEKLRLVEDDLGAETQPEPNSQLDLDFTILIHQKVMAQLSPQEALKPYLFQKESSEGWDEIAVRLNKTPTAVRKEVSRLRRKHWAGFRDEVAQIASPADRAEETKYLYELLFRNLPPQ